MKTEQEQPLILTSESIKLIKGMKGNYSWEIKILETDPDRIMKLNNEMLQRFGELE